MSKRNIRKILKENPNARHTDGRTHLCIASTYGHYPLVKHALECGADPNSFHVKRNIWDRFFGLDEHQVRASYIPLCGAVQNGHASIVSLLIQKGAKVNILGHNDVSMLYHAVRTENEAIVNMLLDAKANLFHNSGYISPVFYAIEYEITPIIEIFIQRGFHLVFSGPGKFGMVYSACHLQKKDLLSRLLHLGADPNISFFEDGPHLLTAIGNSTESKKIISIVQILLEAGANPNFNLNHFEFPLIRAAKNGLFTITKLLLQAGANPDVCTKNNETALFFACKKGYDDIVRLLLVAGAKHNIVALNTNESPFTIACFNYEITKLLLAMGANINHQTSSGTTALMDVANAGYYNILVFLLAAGADTSIVNKQGDTALSIATANGFSKFVEVLESVPLPLQSICICKIELEEIRKKFYELGEEFIL